MRSTAFRSFHSEINPVGFVKISDASFKLTFIYSETLFD